jgi:hypothetical protein
LVAAAGKHGPRCGWSNVRGVSPELLRPLDPLDREWYIQ